MSDGVIGPDIASVDGLGAAPGFGQCRSSGHARFVGLRAVYGSVPDSRYADYKRQLGLLGIPSFAYAFLRFGDGMASPEVQIQSMMSVIGPQSQHELTPAIDLELGGKRPPGWSPAQCLDWFKRGHVELKKQIGVMGGTYTSYVVWVDPAQMDDPAYPDLVDSWCWDKYWPIATRQPAVYDPEFTESLPLPPIPPPFDNQCAMQQYQGDAIGYPGLIGTCDLNVVRTIAIGSAGGMVRYIQKRVGVSVDGSFGPATQHAVQTFQSSKGLVADGIVGLETLSALTWVRV